MIKNCMLRSPDERNPEANRACDHHCGTCGWNPKVMEERQRQTLKKLKDGRYGYVTERKKVMERSVEKRGGGATRNGMRDERIKLGLSKKDLGALVGVSEWAISHIEAGQNNPRKSTMVKLCQALGKTWEELQ